MAKKQYKKNFVSVIIPAFRQEATIIKDIKRIESALTQLKHSFEIIVVVDGMIDKTYTRAKKLTGKNISIVGYEKNKGKGYAIRYGMVRSKGAIVGFIDSGMDLHPKGLTTLLEHIKKQKLDIVIGSKRHVDSKVIYPWNRRILSICSQLLIRALFGLNVKDTQVGMKFFRREVLEDVMPRLLVKRFAFDIEMLVVAFHLGYRKIAEAPIDIRYNFTKSVVAQDLARVIFKTLWDTIAIFYRLKIRRYYDSTSKRKWKFDPELDFRINVG